MKHKTKSRAPRALALLCVCLLTIPMLSITAQAGVTDSIPNEISGAIEEGTVCNCETKCETESPAADCPVCAADVTGCTGRLPGTAFSENSNAVTRDLLYDQYTNKQFISVQTRGGETFYIIIDYDKPVDEEGNLYETYFLNMVDERDLLDIIEEEDLPVPDEPVEVPVTEPEPTNEPEPAPVDEPEDENSSGAGGILLVVLILVVGGGALWYFKLRKPKQSVKGSTDLDDYDFDDEEEAEEYVNEDANELDYSDADAEDEREAEDK